MVTFLCKDDVYKYSSHRVFSKIDTPFQWQIRGWSRTDEHKQFFLAKSDCFVKKTCYICYHDNGPIFLRRFRLYVLSFMFRFMFVNICFEKNQNVEIHVMLITKHNMEWNRDLQFLGCLGSQGSREKSSFNLCKLCYVKHKHKS